MSYILSTEEIHPGDRLRVGGKGYALSLLVKGGFKIPRTVCITSDAYQEYVNRTGLRERILLELHRKEFKEMRWEEIWDCATRIRNIFLTKALPDDLTQEIRNGIIDRFHGRTVAVRSSATEEDDARSSFAGLHESYINVAGAESILKHIRLVWASLWSDAALLYRQEIGLDVAKSSMAVVIQETVAGGRSGVVFTRNPNDENQGIIESVHGLNQGLVDGTVEPDRWIMDRSCNTIVSHTAPERKYWIIPSQSGVHLAELPGEKSANPPLNSQEAVFVFKTARQAEAFFKLPQDVEWTLDGEALVLLQSRPITTLSSDMPADERGWYLSLHRSFDNLKSLRLKIEQELIPGMIAAAATLSATDLVALSDKALAIEIKKRWEINRKWVNIYWADFIPYAHGARLFGQAYNDAVNPQEAKRRLENQRAEQAPELLQQVLEEVDFENESPKSFPAVKVPGYKLQARQLIGQPAGPGIAKGKARVIRKHSDLADFKYGEVLVCDAVDPNITFIVPLATAVVERRGGMLIHGAIIAREYGLPCITGIPDATILIQTGDDITVDGYLGIVTLGSTGP
jgi:pyruvate,water dikinase